MSDCQTVERLAAAYVDGDVPSVERQSLEAHVRLCGRCRSRLAAERSVHAAMTACRAAFQEVRAPLDLSARCARLRVVSTAPESRWYSRAWPVALAATLVLAAAGVVVNLATRASVQVVAAELAADHVKCSMVNSILGTRHDHGAVEGWLASAFSWVADLPDASEEAGLELVGARTCLYGEGRVAHVMYRYEGRPVSVFMLPETERARDIVEMEVLGHREAVWSQDGRTFVLVTTEPEAETRRLASYVRTALRSR
jgi:anti-sigma factor RsiW